MRKKQILVIDDEQSLTRLLKVVLEAREKYQVHVENTGAAGVAATRKLLPDLILLDVVLPDMSGLEVTAQIEAAYRPQSPPIVFLTAMLKRTAPGTPERTIHGYSFLAKPVTVEELLACLEKHLSDDRQHK
jgi:two-component system, sensor histidine kinase and response regulator